MKQILVLTLIVTYLTGCASMFSGTTQKLTLRSEVPGTDFYVNDEKVGTDNVIVTIPKKRIKNTEIVAKKEGCTNAISSVDTAFDATTLLGVFVDLGLFSILLVDYGINGATREATKTNYMLNPTCRATASTPAN
jgi:uncharacterized protein YceK